MSDEKLAAPLTRADVRRRWCDLITQVDELSAREWRAKDAQLQADAAAVELDPLNPWTPTADEQAAQHRRDRADVAAIRELDPGAQSEHLRRLPDGRPARVAADPSQRPQRPLAAWPDGTPVYADPVRDTRRKYERVYTHPELFAARRRVARAHCIRLPRPGHGVRRGARRASRRASGSRARAPSRAREPADPELPRRRHPRHRTAS